MINMTRKRLYGIAIKLGVIVEEEITEEQFINADSIDMLTMVGDMFINNDQASIERFVSAILLETK